MEEIENEVAVLIATSPLIGMADLSQIRDNVILHHEHSGMPHAICSLFVTCKQMACSHKKYSLNYIQTLLILCFEILEGRIDLNSVFPKSAAVIPPLLGLAVGEFLGDWASSSLAEGVPIFPKSATLRKSVTPPLLGLDMEEFFLGDWGSLAEGNPVFSKSAKLRKSLIPPLLGLDIGEAGISLDEGCAACFALWLSILSRSPVRSLLASPEAPWLCSLLAFPEALGLCV